MAVRRIQRPEKFKRSEYVYSDDSINSTLDTYSSSDENASCERPKYKVRDTKSIQSLRKQSRSYENSEDHAYTSSIGVKRARKDTDSTTNSQRVSNKRRCESKNAVNARINRERKKAYVSGLEEEIEQLKEINKSCVSRLESKDAIINNLTDEVSRLKCLVANDKYLFALVNKISHVTGLPVSSSFLSSVKKEEVHHPRTRSVPPFSDNHPIARKDVLLGCSEVDDFESPVGEDNYSLFPSFDSDTISDFDSNDFLPFDCLDEMHCNEPVRSNMGICVHINRNRLSVEFCSLCNSRA